MQDKDINAKHVINYQSNTFTFFKMSMSTKYSPKRVRHTHTQNFGSFANGLRFTGKASRSRAETSLSRAISWEHLERCRTQRRASVPSLKQSSNPQVNNYSITIQYEQHTIHEETSKTLAHCAGATCMNNHTLNKTFAGRLIDVKDEF